MNSITNNNEFIKKIPISNSGLFLNDILNSIGDINKLEYRKIFVRALIYYIKDCDYLINNYNTKKEIQNYIHLIESWLKNSFYNIKDVHNDLYDIYIIMYNNNYGYNLVNCFYKCVDFFWLSTNGEYQKKEEIRNQKLIQYKKYLINLFYCHLSCFNFINDDYKLFQQELKNRIDPDLWKAEDWFNFLNMLQDQYNIDLVVCVQNYYVINPSLGNYNIKTKDNLELNNIIAESLEFKDFKMILYDKIINIK